MGSKTVRVKGAGSQSVPAPAHTAPQHGSGNGFRRGRILPLGVGFGIAAEKATEKTTKIKDFYRAATGVAALFLYGGCPMAEKNKKKFPLWIYPETRQLVTDWYQRDNCQSQSEFIEKAIRFYCGYISAEEGVRFLPAAITSALTGMVDSLENRMARLIFKLAVEMAMMMNILAANAEVDEALLRKLRGKCVDDAPSRNRCPYPPTCDGAISAV